MRTDKEKLRRWQRRLASGEAEVSGELARMDTREALYRGRRTLRPVTLEDFKDHTPHVRNLCAELIEAETDSAIPQPKITARRRRDEDRARLLEDMVRNELDRLPMEQINDLMERVVPIQGGGGYLVEWDNTQRSHSTVGEVRVTALHPRQIIPQPGVTSGVEDMDWIILKLPQTKEHLRRRYGVDLTDEGESEPEVRGSGANTAEDLVTQYVGYYRNDEGGVGVYSWVNETQLEDLEDCQARRSGQARLDEELLELPVLRADGTVLPAGTRLPYYSPRCYPVVLQKNVSVAGKLLGESDIDKIADQQNTTNRIEAKILDKLCTAGSYLILPDRPDIQRDAEELKVVYAGGPAEKSLIGSIDVEGNISQDLVYLNQVYEEARQAIGITDSFQGRHDATATSGKAKEFAAAQTAGRLESKRAMKQAAYAQLFELIVKFRLAYADEPRPVLGHDERGKPRYQEFNRYDFFDRDDTGAWYLNDQFLFSCDAAAPLAANRPALWQETRQNLTSGAFGDPADPQTLLLFWSKMEELHYPGAGETRRYIEGIVSTQQRAQQESAARISAQTMPQMPQMPQMDAAQQVVEAARRAALRDAQLSGGVSK